jgi:hypothetical protein
VSVQALDPETLVARTELGEFLLWVLRALGPVAIQRARLSRSFVTTQAQP